jgi:hypothetical protein
MVTEVLSERVRKKVAKELGSLMDVNPEEWVNDVRATRHEM